MIFPPTFVRIRAQKPGQSRLGWWLPVFLLWPLMAFVTLLVPLILFLKALFGGGWKKSFGYLGVWFLFLLVLCRTRTLHVHTVDEESDFLLSVY